MSFFNTGFEDLNMILEQEGIDAADYYLFDCGFSSPQIDQAERGFSFMRNGPLDMRMSKKQTLQAKDIIETWSEIELADIFNKYSDERFSRRIAKAIVRRRLETSIETTQELADVILQAIPARYRHQEGIHPSTRVFQALRIVVNNELDSLREGLQSALDHLQPGGRIAVLSYHSLEHRIVKELFRRYCGVQIHAPGIPVTGREEIPKANIVTKKAVKPCAAEKQRNPRSRSAQLRVLEKQKS